ncbi:alpha/beta fold hydrolase [Thorsellia anophelis]|uniref:Esterase n=1 Tax=Thorsellia anophelis DSM 18579 TaxID=1123402 RepID=A0A1I0EIN9_9GAMM|nr:alpha/beta fold hydrolase [Thorsellia anophelis]SET45053.1 esterase [Thorsellia anophelis DSM 18579]
MSPINNLLHYHYIKSSNQSADSKPTIVMLHGLFGAGSNLKILATALEQQYHILLIDLRNHGSSFHANLHTYDAMALDVLALLDTLDLETVTIIGHSMGGKVAMQLTTYLAKKLTKLIILDIAPVKYEIRRHDDIFKALKLIQSNQIIKRPEASQIFKSFELPNAIAQFLLKSFVDGSWKFNLAVLEENYDNILGWDEIESTQCDTLFLIGSESDYVTAEHKDAIIKQFPNSKAHIINGADHWVHADKPEQVIRTINSFLMKKQADF